MLNNSNFIDRIRLPFRKEKELYSSLYRVLGFYPRNIQLYKQALMHKSVKKRNEKGRPLNNERLEFLGDAILDAVVGDIVFRHFEGKREGFLTNARSKLVQIGMDCKPDNWNERLDQKLTKDLHLINAFHNLLDHTNFALTDFIFCREFDLEYSINYTEKATHKNEQL